MSDCRSSESTEKEQDKRIRRLYQSILQRRLYNHWTVLDFPYLVEIVRHDSSYLRRILNFIFTDHPVLSQYLITIAWREVHKEKRSSPGRLSICQCELLPVGFERTVWRMYKRQAAVSNIWSPRAASTVSEIATEKLPQLSFDQFIEKINGVIQKPDKKNDSDDSAEPESSFNKS